ncbi:MAG: hypothetical protein RR229_07875, partial [Oscillospiraceae bacterium]
MKKFLLNFLCSIVATLLTFFSNRMFVYCVTDFRFNFGLITYLIFCIINCILQFAIAEKLGRQLKNKFLTIASLLFVPIVFYAVLMLVRKPTFSLIFYPITIFETLNKTGDIVNFGACICF